jgi:hypothetical protein
MKKLKIFLFTFLFSLSFITVSGTSNSNSSGGINVVTNSLPLCGSQSVVQTKLALNVSNSINPSWQYFWNCYGGPQNLKGFIYSVTFIGSDGTRVNAYTASTQSPQQTDYTELVNSSIQLLNNTDASTLFTNGSFTLSSIEVVLSNIFSVKGQATLNDGYLSLASRTCGTASNSFSNYSFSNPMLNSGGTFNGRPQQLYQNPSPGSNNPSLSSVWWQLDSVPFLPPTATNIVLSTTNTYSGSNNSNIVQTTGAYASQYTIPLTESDSAYLSSLTVKLVDANGNNGGWNYIVGGSSGNTVNSTKIVATMNLRNPFTLTSKSKVNLNLKLDLSKFMGWSFYANVGNSGNITPGLQGATACQNLTLGTLLMDIQKVAIKNN